MQDLIERTVQEVTHGAVFKLLLEETQAQIRALPDEEVRDAARRTLTRPLPGDTSQSARLLLNPCLAVQWLSAFEELKLLKSLRVFEPCAGSSEPVLLAAEIYSEGTGEYTTINLNRPLAGQLRDKLAKFKMKIHIIEDNALHADAHLQPGSIDIACFHHAINDILQTAVAEPRGMDTRTVDWWANERQMIEWLAEEAEAGQLDAHARPALVEAVRQALDLVRPGGFLLFDHWTWEGHRNNGWLPWELFCSLIPLARDWIGDAGLPVKERPLAGRDSQWWMCLQKQ